MRTVEKRRGAQVRVEGRPTVDFASNDYLGLAADPRLASAAGAALGRAGTGAAAAPLICGHHPLHQALERELAALKGAAAALLFSSGYAANLGAIPALVGRGDAVYSDALNHASLIDGCRLSRAETRIFPHADPDALDALLAGDAGRFRRRLIVVDAVFSMDGDLFPLDALVRVARRHGAWTYVDDAHGTGVLGAGGRGAAERWGVEGEIDVVMGTLGKALGAAGAFVAGSAAVRDLLLNRARSFVFSTAPPPALAAAALEALRIVRGEPWRRERLRANARRLRGGLRALGRPAGGEPDGHIVPVVIGAADATVSAGDALREAGYLVGAVRPPTVPAGTSRLRITLSAAHTDEEVDGLLAALAEVLPGSLPIPG
ncbi:MAG TPA: 8-amino-7-oxononanoate synthase [Longimicrobiaceae bacterium]|nr:8-amino-7-oxononanoate synthase [Longimicrobiaceae bacterium]